MSILSNPGAAAGTGIVIRCPKCQARIKVYGFDGDVPVRCGSCGYPLVTGDDLMPLIHACGQVTDQDMEKAECAAGILSFLSESIPEAVIVLSGLVERLPFLRVNDNERFSRLIYAYSGGNPEARDYLDKMCQSNPESYEMRICRNCGAHKYIERRASAMNACIYCQSTD